MASDLSEGDTIKLGRVFHGVAHLFSMTADGWRFVSVTSPIATR